MMGLSIFASSVLCFRHHHALERPQVHPQRGPPNVERRRDGLSHGKQTSADSSHGILAFRLYLTLYTPQTYVQCDVGFSFVDKRVDYVYRSVCCCVNGARHLSDERFGRSRAPNGTSLSVIAAFSTALRRRRRRKRRGGRRGSSYS